MPEEPKGDEVTGEGKEIFATLPDDLLYGGEAPKRDDPSQSPPDPMVELAAEVVEGDGEAGAGKPADEPKPKPKPTGQKPEGEEKVIEDEAGEEDAPRPVVLWDTDRQAKDQEKANERKTLEAQLAAKEAQIADLTAKAQAKADKPGATREDKDAADELETLEKEVQDLDPENMDTGQMKATMLKLAKAVRVAKSSGDSEDLRKQVEELKAERESEKTERQKGTERDQAARRNAALNRYLEGLDSDYSPKLRNEASELVAKMIADEGYTADRLPDLPTAKH